MRVLITGGKGQLGQALQRALTRHEVSAPAHSDLDITSSTAIHSVVHEFRPDIVINCAALTDTAAAERDPDAALAVNGEGARNVAAAGVPVVYLSTNEVFDGTKGEAYDEDDAPNPINEYGRSKHAGEEAVRETTDNHFIVRTSWVYGPGRVSFPEKIIERALKDGRIRGVTDEIASPTWTNDLAAAIEKLIGTEEYGTYHLAGEGSCSRLEWAEEVLRLAAIDVATEAATQADFDLPFRKPIDSTLANKRAAALGVTLRPWLEALAEHVKTRQVTDLIAAGARG
jgi:dTDP-4-dehydrorhamnose reductase